MLCERLAGRTGILLRVGRTAKFLKLSDLYIKIKKFSFEINMQMAQYYSNKVY